MTKQEAIEILNWIPTKGDEVDAMEMAIEALSVDIVRCKDCKYWAGENGERITIPVHENCYFFVADDYCSYGERGEADDETGSD